MIAMAVALAGADGPVEHEVLASGDEVKGSPSCAPPVGGHLQVGPVIAVEGACRRESRHLFASERRRLDRSRESGSAVNHRSMKSSWLGVAPAGVPASTLRVRVRLRLIFRMRSLFLGRGRAPASGLRDHRISGSDAHRSSSVVRAVMNRS